MFASKSRHLSSKGRKSLVAVGVAALASATTLWPHEASAFGGASASLICGQMGPPMFGSAHPVASDPGACPGYPGYERTPAGTIVRRRVKAKSY